MKKLLTLIATAALMVLAVASCEKEPQVIPLEGIELNQTAVTLEIGQTVNLTATLKPSDATDKPEVVWSSSNEAVATVAAGLVKAVAAGQATITAKADKFSATCAITVNAAVEPEPEYTGPVQGTSAWSVVGTLLDSKWGEVDYVCAEADGAFVLKNVKLAAADEFKFRKDKAWGVNRGGDFAALGQAFEAVPDGPNVKVGQEGLFDLYYFAEKEAIVVVAKDGAVGDVPSFAQEPDDWDYTPSAEYNSADNLWKAVDGNATVSWYYNPNWAGELPAPETSFKESTYTVKLVEEDTQAEWTSQMWIKPASDFLLDVTKKYTFTCKVHSTTGTHVFIKMYQDGVNWPESFETPAGAERINIPAGETVEIKVEDFIPLETPQMLLIDFANHGANNTIHVKDIVVKQTGEVPPPEPAVDWDFTPGEEFLAANNLWKAKATGNEGYYYYHCTGTDWNGSDVITTEVPFLSYQESTYVLDYPEATGSEWQNQFFIYPAAGHEIALDAEKTYKLKVTMGGTTASPAFFKLAKFNPGNTTKYEGDAIWEYGHFKTDPAHPTVIESPEINGVATDNILLVMDFGGNPAETKIYIKDVTLVQVGGDEPAQGQTVTEILALEKGAEAVAAESLVSAVTSRGFVATDGTKAVYVYTQGSDFNGVAKVGDKVTFSGSKTVYNGVHEIEKVTALTVVSSGNEVNYPAAKDITATVADYDNTEAEYITYTGTLTVSGTYYNVLIDGADSGTKQGSIVFPADADAVKALEGKHLRITGYFNGLTSKGKFVNVIATGIEEVAEAGAGAIVLDGDLSDWDGIEAFAGKSGGTVVEWKYTADAKNIYFYAKIDRSDIKAGKTEDPEGSGNYPFNWRRYFYIAIDTDNNAATPTADKPSKGDFEITGCEVLALVYPFRGNSTSASGTDGATVVNGEDVQSWIKLNNETQEGKLAAWGVIEDDFGYVEMSLPKASIDSPTGTMKAQLSFSSNLTNIETIEIK